MGPAQLCANDDKKCQCRNQTGLAPPFHKHVYASMSATMSFEDLCVLEAYWRRAGTWKPDVEDGGNRGGEYLKAQPTKTKLSSYAVLDGRCGLVYDRTSGSFVTGDS